MPTSFSPRFVDLVRCTCSTTGTGNLVLGAAVAGFQTFAASLSVGDRFYYSVAGIDKPAEAEVGRGTLMADGSIAREAIVGSLTNFSIGQKTVSLVAGAEWFRKASAGAVDMSSVATRAQSDLGAAINELVGLTPLFSEIGVTRVPATMRRIVTAGRTSVGVAPAAYIRDPDQSALTSVGQEYVDALPVSEQAAATSAVKAILDRVRTKDADNQYWVIEDSTQQVHAGHFGAIADGHWGYDGSTSGTDNFAAIQALIDWRTYLKPSGPGRECVLPPGLFRISNGLQLGYGDTFRTVVLRGAGAVFGGGYSNGGGTGLICDFVDRPGIAIQGGRVSYVADLSMVSPKGIAYVMGKQLAQYDNSALSNFGIDDRDLTQWFDPAQPTMSPYLRYNPFAAIAIDPYAGAQPAAAAAWAAGAAIAQGEYRTANGKLYIAKNGGTTAASGTGPAASVDNVADNQLVWAYAGPASVATSYPAAPIPAFLPATARSTYRAGKALSSNFPLSNLRLYGFTVGLAVQPCDNDGNGDFGELSNCEISFGAFQLSVGNTQARNNNAYRLTGQCFHTAITTTKHGRQNGKLGGIFQNCSFSNGMQLIDLGNTAIVGPHTFKQCYGEDIQRIGEVVPGGGAAGNAIVFEACQFEFTHHIGNGKRGVPLYLLGNRLAPQGAGTLSSSYVFRDCIITGFKGVAAMLANGVRLDNSALQEVDCYTFGAQWRARAFNTLAGGLVVPELRQPGLQLLKYTAANETALTAGTQVSTTRANRSSSRNQPASIYTPSLCAPGASSNEDFTNPAQVAIVAKATFSAMMLSGRTLTFTLPGGSLATARDLQLWPGSVMLDASSGMLFFVQAVTAGYGFTAELQNGYSYSASGAIAYEKSFNPASGYGGDYFFVAGGGVFSPTYPLFADLSPSSPTLENCQRADGYGGFINSTAASPIQQGDFPSSDSYVDLSFNVGHMVTGVTDGAITLNAPPTITATKRRLPLWVRGS